MSEESVLSVIIALSGVGIGWLLSQVTDLNKNRQKRIVIKKALTNELSIVKKAFSVALEKGQNRIPDEYFPFITETYNSVKIELASFIEPDALAKIQRTYQEIEKLNERKGLVIAGSLDHIFQGTHFDKLIKLIDDSITELI